MRLLRYGITTLMLLHVSFNLVFKSNILGSIATHFDDEAVEVVNNSGSVVRVFIAPKPQHADEYLYKYNYTGGTFKKLALNERVIFSLPINFNERANLYLRLDTAIYRAQHLPFHRQVFMSDILGSSIKETNITGLKVNTYPIVVKSIVNLALLVAMVVLLFLLAQKILIASDYNITNLLFVVIPFIYALYMSIFTYTLRDIVFAFVLLKLDNT